MTASYPSSIRAYVPRVDLVDTVIADNVNSLQEEVVAIETTLGSAYNSKNPLVSTFGATAFTTTMNGTSGTAWLTVADRLTNIENGLLNGAGSSSPYINKSGGGTITTSSNKGLVLQAGATSLNLLEAYSSGAVLGFNLDTTGTPKVGANNVLYVNSTDYNNLVSSISSASGTGGAAIPKSTVTAVGDLIIGTGSATIARLGIGTNGQALVSNGTTAVWGAPVDTTKIPLSTVSTAGDLILATGSGSVTRLGIGTSGQLLTSNGTTASWQTLSTPYVNQTNGTVTTASTASGVVRNIYVSTTAPSGGIDGDVWLVYI
jgi:hypothetical protein